MLFEGQGAPGSINHLGVETEAADEVVAAEARLRATGLETTGIADTECCYASKTETWLAGPDGARWKWYVKTADTEQVANVVLDPVPPAPPSPPPPAVPLAAPAAPDPPTTTVRARRRPRRTPQPHHLASAASLATRQAQGEALVTLDHVIEVLDRRSDAERFRRQHPTLQVEAPVWEATPHGGVWTWSVSLEAGPTFVSRLELDLGESVSGAPAPGLGAVLAVIDALSYWKAAVPARVVLRHPLPGTREWWDSFVANSMGEHLWRNGLDLDWLPAFEGELTGKPVAAPDRSLDPGSTLALHSGGKDSITAAHLAYRAGRAVRPISYQPTSAMRSVVEASAPPRGWAGLPVAMRRRLDPALLDLNAAGYLNGHTPYSAWLAVAASAAADLCGVGHVAAGNSRSDDEPNITAEMPSGDAWPINHQWTKSAAFESAWAEIAGPDRRYASPLRPLYELAVLSGLHAGPLPATDRALSCNRAAKAGRDGSWCGRCPKCLWTASALDAIGGPGAGAARLGLDPLADLANVDLLRAMCGRSGPVPFECAGTPAEVRAVLRELARRPSPPVAVASLDPTQIEVRPHQDADLNDLIVDHGPAPLLDPTEHRAAQAWATTAHAGLYGSTPSAS